MYAFKLGWFPATLMSTILVLLPVSARTATEIKVGKNVQVSSDHANLVHDEVLVNADPSHPNRLIACVLGIVPNATAVRLSDEVATFPWYGIVYMSNDSGKTWRLATEYKPTASTLGLDNHCAFGADGSAFFITGVYERGPDTSTKDDLDHDLPAFSYLLARRSTDDGQTWSNWLMVPQSFDIDRQFIIADDTNRKYRGRLYITGQSGMRSVDGKSQGLSLNLWRSLDDGKTFERPLRRLSPLTSPSTISVYNPWNPVILSDGTVALLFRDLTASKGRTLNIVFSRDGGDSLSKPYKIADANDAGMSSLAVDRTAGPFADRLYAIWDDTKRPVGPLATEEIRTRILLAYSTDRGKTWSKPIVVDDDRDWPIKDVTSPQGPADVVPSIAVNSAGVVGVAWLDRRANPGNRGYWARFSASVDGGETWAPSVRLSEKPNTYLQNERVTTLATILREKNKSTEHDGLIGVNVERQEWAQGGHTIGLAAGASGSFHPLWVDNRTGIHQVWTSQVDVAAKAVKNGSEDLATLSDVSNDVELEVLNSNYDRSSQRVALTVRLTNKSKNIIRAPIKARVLVLQSDFAIPRVENADNHETGTGAVWDFSSVIPNGELKPGEASGTRTLVMQLANARPIDIMPHAGDWNQSLVNFKAKVLAQP